MTSSLVGFHGDPPTHLTFEALEALGVPHLSTTRHCLVTSSSREGTAPFTRGARDLLRRHALDLGRVAFLHQVHGATIRRVDGASRGPAGRADVLLTAVPAVPLAVSTADCLAIIVCDPVRRLLAVAHAGWRGTISGIARAAAEALVAAGASPTELVAAISPSIGPCCYEVDSPVIGPLRRAFPEAWQRWVRPSGPGKWMLDLWQANEFQLTSLGVRPAKIVNPRLCTSCRRDLFFSYRKERGGGRLVTVAALPSVRAFSA
ncbi:MAG: peptidoglycan editing factor PgeF [Candidatus Methylomirabilia bacterium]